VDTGEDDSDYKGCTSASIGSSGPLAPAFFGLIVGLALTRRRKNQTVG